MSRVRLRTAVVALALALTVAGCAGAGSDGADDRAGPGRAASDDEGRYADPTQEDRSEPGWRSSDPDLGSGRYRDPLGPQRRTEPTQREWRRVFSEEFDTLDPALWKTYDGVPGCCPDAVWDPSMVRVEDGSLFLDTTRVDGRWLSGGVGTWETPMERQYGRWDMRVRTDADARGVTVAALLWPADGSWPPEIDFYEIFETEPDRREMTVTNHYGEITEDGAHDATRRPVRANFARWRVMSLRWTPEEIQVVMDGRAVETIRVTDQVPDMPMWLAVQTAVKRIGSDDPAFTGTRSTQIDWVRVYEPA